MSSINSAITQTNNEFSAAVAANSSTGNTEMGKESFLLLLVTQLKNQDPLNPTENTEFVSQLAQYSSLEQLMSLNEGMTSLTKATENQQMINATSYIGKEVAASGNSISKETDSEGKTTVSTFRYALGSAISTGTISVYDSSNQLVYQETLGAKTAGTTYSFTWDGKNLKGAAAADGVYSVQLSALDADGKAVLSDQVVDGKVTGVLTEDGTVYLGLSDGRMVSLANVRQVSEPTVVSSSSDSTTGTTGAAA